MHKLSIHNKLTEYYSNRRLQFYKKPIDCLDKDELNIENILFSDESTNTLNGKINRQNPGQIKIRNRRRKDTLSGFKNVNDQTEIICDRVVGPIFFGDSLNGAGYLEFLQEEV